MRMKWKRKPKSRRILAAGSSPVGKHEIINRIAAKIGAKKYLEIGVEFAWNFTRVGIDHKVGVDPAPQVGVGEENTTHKMTSSEFFNTNKEKFDIIFVDGLHHSEQVYEDVINALHFLNEGGYVVCHDMNPLEERYQIVPRASQIWQGDCWKAWVKLRLERSDLDMCVVDADWGCGIIKVGRQEIIEIDDAELTYEGLDKNRQYWLNLVSVEDFFHRLDLA